MSTPTETMTAHLRRVEAQVEAISIWLLHQRPHPCAALTEDECDDLIARLHVVATRGEEISLAARQLGNRYLSQKSHDQNA